MSDFFGFVVFVFLALAAVVALAVGISIGNAHWNCSQWAKHTGDTTQVMAGECYVRNGARWELFDTYIRNHHVDVEAKP